MTKKYIGPGDVLDWTNGTGSAVSSNDVVQLDFMCYGIALTDIANGAEGSVQRVGVFELAKTTSQAWVAGDPLYWDTDNEKLTTTPGLYAFIGYASESAASAAAVGKVLLAPFSEDPMGDRLYEITGAGGATAIPATAFLGGNLTIAIDLTSAAEELDLPSVALFPYGRELEVESEGGSNAVTVDPAATDNFDGGTDGAAVATIDAAGDRIRWRSVAAGFITIESELAA